MSVQLTKDDSLSHISFANDQLDPDDPKALRNQVAAIDGSITIVAAFGCKLVLNWSFTTTALNISLVLDTPVGSITLGSASLNPSNPTFSIGGSIDSFKAEATVSFDFSSMTLTASGEVCAPLVGCKKGSISVNV
jgi:hypothetical protein